MKLIVLLAGPCVALAAVVGSKGSQLVTDDAAGCVKHASAFITKPMKKGRAIEQAMDHCAMDKKVDDKNFVCPHYREVLTGAFRREPTTQTYTAEAFCDVTELYVSQLEDAAKVPNLGKGTGKEFELSKDCKPTVMASMAGKKTLPADKAADFWYALCMNQDCAHFLPSRTRWCKHDHQPTHSQSVCESVRVYAQDEVHVMSKNLGLSLDADQVCGIYDDFVEDTHANVMAYQHVVHGIKEHNVVSPANKKRALDSAKMKNEASGHKLRDSAGEPVKSGAAKEVPAFFLAVAGIVGLIQ